ncbi:hypothetical protein K4G61_g3469 [Candida parapsilosis]|nr:hypothetical protein K4G61_g3469 [Candida parapsilosis]
MSKDELDKMDTSSTPVVEANTEAKLNEDVTDHDKPISISESTDTWNKVETHESDNKTEKENGKTSDSLADTTEAKLEEGTANAIEFQNNVIHSTIDELKGEATTELSSNNASQLYNEDNDDDGFDDFDEFAAAEPNTHKEEGHEFDDFGDFDEFETVNEETTIQRSQPNTDPAFPDSCFSNKIEFESRLSKLLSKLFITNEGSATARATSTSSFESPTDTTVDKPTESLLNDRSRTIYKQISTMPYLHPPNWIRSDIRHNLLIKLGIPINLDELNANNPGITTTTSMHQGTNTSLNTIHSSTDTNPQNHLSVPSQPQRSRKKSISEQDINWSDFTIPEFDSLKLTNDQLHQILSSTNGTISKIEYDLMENTSRQFLHDVKSDDVLDAKLTQLSNNHQELLKLSSIWQHQLHELRKDYEIYEQVVQSCIGYSQKLRREEILENLKKMRKHSSVNASSSAFSSSSSSASASKQKKKFWKK